MLAKMQPVAAALLALAATATAEEICGNITLDENLRLCKGGSGIFFPVYPTAQAEWSQTTQVILYLFGLLWLFAGVALLADAFMAAIEVITSEEVTKNDGSRDYKAMVWNPTVANLTLMALGSSAPEIVLAIVEIAKNDMFTGDLGPSTIVGSAAFNLFVIVGICVMSIPSQEDDRHNLGYRRVKSKTVLKVTAFNSVFAYLWLLFILTGPSPDLIEPWEGVMTFMFCPIMVIIAYLADKGYFDEGEGEVEEAQMSGVELSSDNPLSEAEIFKRLKDFAKSNSMQVCDLDAKTAADAIFANDVGNVRQTRASYKHGVVDALLHGGKNVKAGPTIKKNIANMKDNVNPKLPFRTVGFEAVMAVVEENVKGGKVKLDVIHMAGGKQGNNDNIAFSVDYATKDGDAHAGRKYHATSGTLHFAKGVTKQTIEVEIIDNDIEENDEFFSVGLTNLRVTAGTSDDLKIDPSHQSTVVTILDDDKPGHISLKSTEMEVSEADGFANIVLVRKGGCRGTLSVVLATADGSAVSPHDYEGLPDGGAVVTFGDGDTEKSVKIKIMDDEQWEKSEMFTVSLSPAPGAAASTVADPKFTEVTIQDNDTVRSLVEKATKFMNVNRHRYALGKSMWADQIWEAVRWPSGDGAVACVVHVILWPWKLIAALVPPTFWAGGKLAFVVALLFIAFITAAIGDIAAMFGCAIGLSDAVTAFTFVALGTSLPDCFASRTAAIQDKTADAAIGNVTGSNAVNVYLGLGLPWMVASIYWRAFEGPNCEWQARYPGAIDKYSKGGFYVPAGNLGFTVGVFVGCAMVAFSLLLFRRVSSGAEFGQGGPNTIGSSKSPTIVGALLISLWFIFVILSSLKVEKMI